MSQASDAWYVLLPDGNVVRAASTLAVRNHVGSGRIPRTSRIRRTPDEEWVGLEWTEEFADLVKHDSRAAPAVAKAEEAATGWSPSPPAGVASRLDPMRLETVGVRALLDELLAAMDSTLVRGKLLIAAVAGVVSAVILAFAASASTPLEPTLSLMIWSAAVVAIVVIAAFSNTLLMQMSYVELARLRPARWAEARAGLLPFALRLILCYLVTGGIPLLAIGVLRWLPVWVSGPGVPDWLVGARGPVMEGVVVAGLVLELVLWPMLCCTLLLGPLIVVEESSVFKALAEWWRLLRRQFGRVFLYEMLAVALAVAAALPFCVPLGLAAAGRVGSAGPTSAVGLGLFVLGGLAAAPFIAYLAVANVFIFLNLHYEPAPRRR
ncbi:MAG TPA: hypothetical protein VG013_40545 [Gemmataceae bacterium]|jgi:hypothetical protein|nr:hypothetical protein [Gemmataceae bacterium]